MVLSKRPIDLPRPALLLSAGIFVLSICSFGIVPLLALYLSTALHSAPGQIGIVLAVMAIANQGLQVAVGIVASRLGNRMVLGVGILLACIGYSGFAFGPPFSLQLLCAFTLGLGRATISLVGKAMLTEEAGDKRASALTLRSVAVNAGAAIGPALGGLLLGWFWLALYGVVAVHALFWLVMVRAIPARRPPGGSRGGRAGGQSLRQQLSSLVSNRVLVGITCASVGFWYLYVQLTFTFPLYANDRFHLGGRVGLLFTLNAVIAVALQYAVITWFIHRSGSWRVLSAGCTVVGAAFLVLAGVPATWALVLFVIVFSLGELAVVPTLDVVTAEVGDPVAVAGSFGFASLGWAAGGLLGSLIGGATYQIARQAGQFGLFWACNGLVGVAAGVAFAVLRRRMSPGQDRAAGNSVAGCPAHEGTTLITPTCSPGSLDLSGYTFRRAPGVPDRNAATWNALLPGSAADFYLCHDWLASIRGTKGYDDLTWSILDHDQRLVGLVPVYTTPEPVNYKLYDLFALFGNANGGSVGNAGRDAHGGGYVKSAWAPQTLIGSRSGYVNAPLIRDRSLLPVWAAAAAQAVTESRCGSAAIPYLDKDTTRELSALLPGSVALLSGGGCRITLENEDFDTYLSRLSRSRRRIIRADLRSFARSDRTITTHVLDCSLIDRLAPLLVNVQRRHGSSVDAAQVSDFLRGCAAPGLGEHSVVFICWQGHEAIGFSLAFQFRSSLTIRVVGLDYRRVGHHAEYFTLLVHEPVRYALSHRLTTVDLGTESYRAKLLRGGQFVPLWSILLISPIPWEQETVGAYNTARLADYKDSFGDLVTDLDMLASLDER